MPNLQLAPAMFRTSPAARSTACCVILCLFAIESRGQEASTTRSITVRNRSELIAALRTAEAGTQIQIAPGTYQGGVSADDLRGSEGHPIVIAAADPDNPPVFQGGGSGMHLTRPRYVELRDLIFDGATGNGLNIDDGGEVDQPAGPLVLRGLRVRDVGPKGNRDGIKLSGLDRFLIDRCVIERWGDAGSAIDMVGCHQGRIRNCEFRYRSDLAANGIQTKGGSSEISIEQCRFEHAGGRSINVGGSTGLPYFRPRGADYEAKDITVQDCTFIGSMAPIAFVGVDGATVRYNTIYRPSRWVIRILQESQEPRFVSCRDGVFSHNLIVYSADEVSSIVNIGAGTSPETFRFDANHWYCVDRPERSQPRGLPTPETNGSYGLAPRFVNEAELRLQLSKDTPVRDAGVRTSPPTPRESWWWF